MFDEQAFKRALGKRHIPLPCPHFRVEFGDRGAEHSLPCRRREIVFARPGDEIVGAEIEMAEPVPQIILDPAQDGNAISHAGDAHQ